MRRVCVCVCRVCVCMLCVCFHVNRYMHVVVNNVLSHVCTQLPDASLQELFVDSQLHSWAVKCEFILPLLCYMLYLVPVVFVHADIMLS